MGPTLKTLGLCTLLLLIPSCTPPEDKAPEAQSKVATEGPLATALSNTWVTSVSNNADAFKALLKESPNQAWVKFSKHQYLDAAQAFGEGQALSSKMGVARSHLALAEVFRDANAYALEVSLRTEAAYVKNADRLAITPGSRLVQGLAHLRLGTLQSAKIAAKDAAKSPDFAQYAQALNAGIQFAEGANAQGDKTLSKVTLVDAQYLGLALKARSGQAIELLTEPPTSLTGKRARFYCLVRSGKFAEAQATLPQLNFKEPDFSEMAGAQGDTEYRYYSPMFLEALSFMHASLAGRALEAGGIGAKSYGARVSELTSSPVDVSGGGTADVAGSLAALMFGSVPSIEDLEAPAGVQHSGLRSVFFKHLGLVQTRSDQGKQVREAQDLSREIQAILESPASGDDPPAGAAYVVRLQLARRLSTALLRDRADQFSEAGRHLEALALLENSFDKDKSSQITGVNGPGLFMSTSRAYFSLNRYRESLNYLFRLVSDYPELWPVYEMISNLSVLDTIDQIGQSQE